MNDIENKKFSFGYEDTDKKIEIELYGLVFEIRNLEDIKNLEDTDQSDVNKIEAQLENILGRGAIEKINNKRINDGYKKLDLNIELNILGCIFQTYANSMTNNVLGKVTDTIDNLNKDVENFNGINREQRRNYNRNSNYRGNRRNYRRY